MEENAYGHRPNILASSLTNDFTERNVYQKSM